MHWKKRGFMVVLLAIALACSVQAQTPTHDYYPDYTLVWCEYSDSTDACRTQNNNDNSSECQASIATGQCLVEGDVDCYGEADSTDGTLTEPIAGNPQYTVNWDATEENCTCIMGTSRAWNTGGEVSTDCCGDPGDAGEFYTWRRYGPGEFGGKLGEDPTDDSCCDNFADCVWSDTCRDDGYYDVDGDGRDDYVCPVGDSNWTNVDYSSAYCIAAGFNWSIGGNADAEDDYYTTDDGANLCNITAAGHPSAECCCGDDTGEETLEPQCIAAGTGNPEEYEPCSQAVAGDEACCDDTDDCVFDDWCYDTGDAYNLTVPDSKDAYCNIGVWEDCDTAGDAYCSAFCGESWVTGGESAAFGEYDTGSETECCEDDSGETYRIFMSGSGAGCSDIDDEECLFGGDDPTDEACCDDPTDCQYGVECFDVGTYHDLDGDSHIDGWCREDMQGHWNDCDHSEENCSDAARCNEVWAPGGESASFGEYDTGSETECCGDDASEYSLYKTRQEEGQYNVTWSDDPTDDACCNADNDCVFNLMCYADGEWEDEMNPGGNDNFSICTDGNWTDLDGAQLDCEAAGLNWVRAGDSVVGEYWDIENGGTGTGWTECCGDDDYEFYTTSGTLEACCNSTDVITFSPGPGLLNCTGDYYMITGQVLEQTEDGSYTGSAGANVSIQNIDNAWIMVSNITSADGTFSILVPDMVQNIMISKPGFTTYVDTLSIISDTDIGTVKLDFNLDCRADCSRAEYDSDFDRYTFRCDKACDGINGCQYNASVTRQSDGQSMKEICHDKELGWDLEHNSSHLIGCCNRGYIDKVADVGFNVSSGSNVRDAQSFYLGTYRYAKDGKLYSAYITIFTKND